MDVVPLRNLVELRQGMSRKDPIAAKNLNALNSRTECINYRVCQVESKLIGYFDTC